MPSRRLSVIVVVVVVFALAVVAVAPAFAATAPGMLPAHARLVGSTPVDGSTVESATEVTLEFNEDVNPDFVTVLVTDPADAEAAVGDPEVDGRTVTQALTDVLPAGEQTVAYRVVSADGHPVAGTLTFTTTARPASSPETTSAASASVSPAPTTAPTQAASSAPTTTGSAPASNAVGDTPWPLVGLVAVLAVLALVIARRVVRGRPSGAVAVAPDGAGAAGPAGVEDAGADDVTGIDGGRVP